MTCGGTMANSKWDTRFRAGRGVGTTELDDRLVLLGRLSADLLHDISNHMTVVLGHAELLTNTELPEPAHESVEEILRSAERGRALARRYLAFVRNEPVLHQPIELNALLADLEPELATTLGRSVRLILGLKGYPLDVLGDAGQLEQMLLSLVTNARDAMPDGGELDVSLEALTLQAPLDAHGETLPPGRYVQITLRDSGVGIAPEAFEHLLEPGFSTKGGGRGASTGLHRSAEVLREHGGGLIIESRLGEGTAVRVLIPRTCPERSA